VLNHSFSHGGHPDHVTRLGGYWAEVFGGPPVYSTSCGGHPHMLGIHAGSEPEESMGPRFVECFVAAADDTGLPADPELRRVLRAYMEWAVSGALDYSRRARRSRTACRCRTGPGRGSSADAGPAAAAYFAGASRRTASVSVARNALTSRLRT
jgi:truncated hemoglobin YjbI